MKLYKASILLFLILPLVCSAQYFKPQESQLINQKIVDLVKQYELLSGFKGDKNTLSVPKQQQFKELFLPINSLHYNDLSVNPTQLLSIDQYLNVLNSDYKNSLSVKLELD